MKNLTLTISLAAIFTLPIACFAQTKKKHNPAYFKLAPSLILQKDKDVALAGLVGMGARIGKYYTAGFGTGYFKLKGASKAVIPLGLDFNVTDFTKKGISPIVTAGLYYPIYKERIAYEAYTATGQFMYSIGGGFALSSSAKKKAAFTVAFSQLFIDAKQQAVTGSIKGFTNINLVVASFSIIL